MQIVIIIQNQNNRRPTDALPANSLIKGSGCEMSAPRNGRSRRLHPMAPTKIRLKSDVPQILQRSAEQKNSRKQILPKRALFNGRIAESQNKTQIIEFARFLTAGKTIWGNFSDVLLVFAQFANWLKIDVHLREFFGITACDNFVLRALDFFSLMWKVKGHQKRDVSHSAFAVRLATDGSRADRLCGPLRPVMPKRRRTATAETADARAHAVEKWHNLHRRVSVAAFTVGRGNCAAKARLL